ncbi:MAG: mechanosensitive ion channel [bacterium]
MTPPANVIISTLEVNALETILEWLSDPWVVGIAAFVAWMITLTIVIRVVYWRLRKFARSTRTDIDDVLIGAMRTPMFIVVLVTGALLAARIVPLNEDWRDVLDLFVKVAVILAGVLFVDAVVKAFLWKYSRKAEYIKSSAGIVQTAVRSIIILIALLIILDTAGVSITPLVASLGVGSLAVALALQSPLANFFAGIQILADKQIDLGQYVKLDTGEEGYVTRIDWRSTTIRALPNNLIVIPNSKIMDAKITNYYLPQRELSILLQMGVHYNSDLEQVERVTIEVAKDVLETVDGGKKDFEPFIRYHTFDSSSINFTVILRAEEFVNGYLLKHEFVKRIHRRFKQEGIVIPFPIRTLDIDREDLLLLRQDASSRES